MIRYAGMLLIMSSCTAGGFIFAGGIKRRIAQLDYFIRFFGHIMTCIERYKYPLERIFATYRDKNLEFFLEKLRRLGRGADGVYRNPWEAALSECEREQLIFFKDEEFALIKEFGARLGEGRVEQQAAHMGLYYSKLEGLYKSAAERELNLAKLYKWSGGLVGIFICILLL